MYIYGPGFLAPSPRARSASPPPTLWGWEAVANDLGQGAHRGYFLLIVTTATYLLAM